MRLEKFGAAEANVCREPKREFPIRTESQTIGVDPSVSSGCTADPLSRNWGRPDACQTNGILHHRAVLEVLTDAWNIANHRWKLAKEVKNHVRGMPGKGRPG